MISDSLYSNNKVKATASDATADRAVTAEKAQLKLSSDSDLSRSDLANFGKVAATASAKSLGLPEFAIEGKLDSSKATPTISKTAADANTITVRVLHQAIQQVDGDKILDALVTRDQEQLNLLEKSYDDQYGKGSFRAGIDNLKSRDKLSVQTILNHVDGETNYADSLRAMLDPSNKNSKHLSYELLNVLSAVSPDQLHKIATDYAERTGVQLTDAIAQNKNLPTQVKSAALDFVLKDSGAFEPKLTKAGSPARTAEDDVALVQLAVSLQKERFGKNSYAQSKPDETVLSLLHLAVGGDSDAAKQARVLITKDSTLAKLVGKDGADRQDLEHLFGDNKIAKAYLTDGRIQLSDIANGDNGGWFIGKNKTDVDVAMQSATAGEKAEYQAGRQLSMPGAQASLTAEQKDSLTFYKNLHKALDNIGDNNDLTHWENLLLGKPDSFRRDKSSPVARNANYLDQVLIETADKNQIISNYQSVARDLVLGFAQEPELKNKLLQVPQKGTLTDREQQLSILLELSLESTRELTPGEKDVPFLRNQLAEKGTLPWQLLIERGAPDDYRKYADIAKVITVEKAAGQPVDLSKLQNSWMGKDGYQVLQQLMAQNGELRTEDLARSFVLSGSPSSSELLNKLSGMSVRDVAALKDSYAGKYHSDLDSDLLGQLSPLERSGFIQRLRNFSTDAGEQYIDNLQIWLGVKGGHVPDASSATVQRINDLTSDEMAKGSAGLDQKTIDKLNGLFKDAVVDYSVSRSEYAAKLKELAQCASVLMIALPTGSMLATFLVTEALNTTIQKAALGSDFKLDPVALLKDAAVAYGSARVGEFFQSAAAARFIDDTTQKVQNELGLAETVSQAELRTVIKSSAQSGRAITSADFASLHLQDPVKAAEAANSALAAVAKSPFYMNAVVNNAVQSTAASAVVSAINGKFDLSILKDNITTGAVFLGAGGGLHTLKLSRGDAGKIVVEPIAGVREMSVVQSNGQTRTVKFGEGATESELLNTTDKILSIDGKPVSQKVTEPSFKPDELLNEPTKVSTSNRSDSAPPSTVPPSHSSDFEPDQSVGPSGELTVVDQTRVDDNSSSSIQLVSNTLAKVRLEMQRNTADSEAAQDLLVMLKSKGVSNVTPLKSALASSDLTSFSIERLTKLASKSSNPEQFVKDVIAWSKGDQGLTKTLQPFQSSLPEMLFSQSDSLRMIDSMLSNLPAKQADAELVLGLIDKSLKGEIVLIDGSNDVLNARSGPYNPAAKADICAAATSAWVQDQLLTESQVLKALNQSLEAKRSVNYETGFVPVVDGKPVLTAEHIQTLFNDASARSSAKSTYDEALGDGPNFVANVTGKKLTLLKGGLDSAPDGLYTLTADIPDDARGGIIQHAMAAIVKDSKVTYYDPAKGKSYKTLPASYTLKSAWSIGS